MYEQRHSYERQQAIRDVNPNATHCMYLRDSAMACESLPARAAEKAGEVCPNNKFASERDLLDQRNEYGSLLTAAFHLEDLRSLGMLPLDLAPEEFTAALAMKHYTKRKTMEASMPGSMESDDGDR